MDCQPRNVGELAWAIGAPPAIKAVKYARNYENFWYCNREVMSTGRLVVELWFTLTAPVRPASSE